MPFWSSHCSAEASWASGFVCLSYLALPSTSWGSIAAPVKLTVFTRGYALMQFLPLGLVRNLGYLAYSFFVSEGFCSNAGLSESASHTIMGKYWDGFWLPSSCSRLRSFSLSHLLPCHPPTVWVLLLRKERWSFDNRDVILTLIIHTFIPPFFYRGAPNYSRWQAH